MWAIIQLVGAAGTLLLLFMIKEVKPVEEAI
jgi:hypothetical protein